MLVARLAEATGAPVVLQDDQLRVLAAAAGGEHAALDPAHCHVTRQAIKRVCALQSPARLESDYQDSEMYFNLQVALRIHQMVRGLR